MNDRYTFTIGDEEKRIYQGKLLSPMDGFEFGLRVAKLILTTIKDCDTDQDIKKSFMGFLDDEESIGSNETLHNIILFLVKALGEFDISEYLKLVYELVKNTCIAVKVDGATSTTVLGSKKELNDWFKDYPGDLLLFTVNILIKNGSPFLPVGFLKQMKSKI